MQYPLCVSQALAANRHHLFAEVLEKRDWSDQTLQTESEDIC